jgi:hypothetical protein
LKGIGKDVPCPILKRYPVTFFKKLRKTTVNIVRMADFPEQTDTMINEMINRNAIFAHRNEKEPTTIKHTWF